MTFLLWQVMVVGALIVYLILGCVYGVFLEDKAKRWEQEANDWRARAEAWERAAKATVAHEVVIKLGAELPNTDERFDWKRGIGVP